MTVERTLVLKGERQALLQLLRPHFLPFGADLSRDISSAERLAIANAIGTEKSIQVNWSADTHKHLQAEINKQFGQLCAAFQAELAFHLKILEGFVRFSHLDRQLTEQLASLRTTLLAHAISDSLFWFKSHPLRRTIDFLYVKSLGWQDTFGKNGEVIAENFQQAIAKLINTPLQDLASFETVYSETVEAYRLTLERFGKLEQRLKDAETGVLKAAVANHAVITFLNTCCKGSRLPPGVAHALQHHLANEFKLFIIQQGLDSVHWLRGKKLVETLVKLYQSPPAADAEKSMLVQLPKELEHFIREAVPNPAALDDFINQVTFDFTHLAVGRGLDHLHEILPLQMPGQLNGIEKKVSKTLVLNARKFTEGQWFLLKDDGDVMKRCQLLLGLPDYDQLLFSNLVGQKVMATSYENFAYLLSSRLMQPLFQGALTDRSVQVTVDRLLENYEELEAARVSAEKQKQMAVEHARQEAERRQAAEKAKAEAERLAAERAERQVQETLAQIADDLRKQARLALDALSLGTWVEWLNPQSGEFKRIKLALKFNATGRFVFVDEDGVTMLEQHKDELVEQVLLKKIKLLESDQRFAERLAKIVNNIRTGES